MLLRQSRSKKRLYAWLMGLVLVLGSGFLLGATAGGSDDPLVTKSWVDTYVNKTFAALENRVSALEAQLDSGVGRVELWLGKTEALVNGVSRTMDVPLQSANGRTMVPLRFVGEALGATVDWNNTTKTVTYVRAARVVKLVMGESTATVNGEVKALDTPPMIQSQRFLVPVRFVSEALGANVNWDNTAKKVTISY